MRLSHIKSKFWDPEYNYFNIDGRISKEEFLDKFIKPIIMLFLFTLLYSISVGLLVFPFLYFFHDIGVAITILAFAGLIALVLSLWVLLMISLFGQVRRFHDLGISGWVVALCFIFGLALIPIIVGVIVDGSPEANRYGETEEYP